MENLKRIEKALKLKFKSQKLLQNAFVHRSYLNENPDLELPSNERLEYLGDAALELVTSRYLFENYPKLGEGEMTALRAALVRTESLAEEARRLGFGDTLLLSKGEEQGGGRDNPYLLANTFEALVGVIYLDRGLGETATFIKRELLYKTDDLIRAGLKDAKSLFQEKAQEKRSITPVYKTLAEWGPDHDKHFRVGVFLGKKKIAEGEGRNKQTAEEAAAQNALKDDGTLRGKPDESVVPNSDN